jgi:hypothetical protein
LTEACQLGNISIRMGGAEIKWDSANLKITNNKEANSLLQMDYRKGWSL